MQKPTLSINMHYLKVTIVTPSYNQAAFLEQTILSVLNQDYPNIEYIVIDGGSRDGSVDIIKKYQHRLAYWVSEPDRGQSHAINKGFQLATGEILNWLNSDDLLMPSAARIAVHYLTEKPEVGMVYGDRLVIDAKGNTLKLIEHPSFNPRVMLYNIAIPQETAFFRRQHWIEVNGVNEALRYCMDYELWIKLNKVTQIYHIPFVLGAYRSHEVAKSTAGYDIQGERGRKELDGVMLQHFSKRRGKMMKKLYKKYSTYKLNREKKATSRMKEIGHILEIINESA